MMKRSNGDAEGGSDAVESASPEAQKSLHTTAATDNPHVFVCVCTRGRPRMLKACLASLIDQEQVENWSMSILVVENDMLPQRESPVAATALPGHPPVIYAHEPRIGIPFARNRAVEVALQRGADWIAFIDDDEIARPDWLASLCRMAMTADVDVVQGPVDSVYLEHTPDWYPRRRRKTKPTGLVLPVAVTNNVMFKADLVKDKGFGLRFDNSLRFTGGSDVDFFYRAVDKGARIVWCQEAVVEEPVVESRTTLSWLLRRTYRVECSASSGHARRRGVLHAVSKRLPRSLFYLMLGTATLPLAPLWFTGNPAARRVVYWSLKQAASGLGGLAGFTPLRPQPYRFIDGD